MEKKVNKNLIFFWNIVLHKFTRNTILLDPFWNPAPPKILEIFYGVEKIWLSKVIFCQIWPPIWPPIWPKYTSEWKIWPSVLYGVYKYYIPPKRTDGHISAEEVIFIHIRSYRVISHRDGIRESIIFSHIPHERSAENEKTNVFPVYFDFPSF